MAKRRPALPNAIRTELLLRSKRRCCLCFGLKADIKVKAGQIAHVDHDPFNNDLDNLVWLCLSHHDQYDSIPRQTKGITLEEIKLYRAQLYSKLSLLMSRNSNDRNEKSGQIKSDQVLEILDRYSGANETVIKEITDEIVNRINLIQQFTLLNEQVTESLTKQGAVDKYGDAYRVELEKLVEEKMKFPDLICVLQTASHLLPSWKEEVEDTAKKWVRGLLTDDEYENLFIDFEERYELDIHFIFFGLPRHNLSSPQIRALSRFLDEHGQRERVRRLRPEPEDVPF